MKFLTVDDLVRAGACREGVLDWRKKFAKTETAVSIDFALKKTRAGSDGRRYVDIAGGLSGYGDGDGGDD